RVEENRRTDCRYVPIAKKLIVIFPVPCRVKRPNTPIVAQQPALHIVMTAFRSLMRFPPGFTNCKHLARHHYLSFGSYLERPPRARWVGDPSPQPQGEFIGRNPPSSALDPFRVVGISAVRTSALQG